MKINRGFNLIEIAIVLAVIGLVIGGIYVAASAVTENNRRQNVQKQLLQIVANVRNVYASQASFVVPSYTQIKAMSLFPGDLQDNGSAFLNPYGGTVILGAGASNQEFAVQINGISQGGCVQLLTKFGSLDTFYRSGLHALGTDSAVFGMDAGLDTARATIACDSSGNYNNTTFVFSLRG